MWRSIGAAEFVERVEEVIVAARAGDGNEAAHGERIDQFIVKMLIFKGLGGGDIAGFARGTFGGVVGFVFGFGEGERGGIDAELIFGGGANKGFGIDGAGEVTVQVGAFGHVGEEEFEFEGVGAGGFEGARGRQFGG